MKGRIAETTKNTEVVIGWVLAKEAKVGCVISNRYRWENIEKMRSHM